MLTTSELVVPSKLEHLAEEFGSLQEPVEQLKHKILKEAQESRGFQIKVRMAIT